MSNRVLANRYEVLEEVGRGSMGIVYRAQDRKMPRIVALKVALPELLSNEKAFRRFTDEPKKWARLEHDNIVRAYDVDHDENNIPFIVMEYVSGTTLGKRIASNSFFSLVESVSITYQIAKALDCAHTSTQAIVHRDIKPDNVLLSSDNRVKLTDFGVAKVLDEPALTTHGQLIGNLAYMAPEQAFDQALDGRADLYALGLIFYEMLTGTHPRRNLSSMQILRMLASEKNTPHLLFPRSVPAEVQAIVHDLVQYQVNARIADARTLLGHLESLPIEGLTIQRPRPKPIIEPPTLKELDPINTKDLKSGEGSDGERKAGQGNGQATRGGGRTRQPGASPLVWFAILVLAIGGMYFWIPRTPPSEAPSAPETRIPIDNKSQEPIPPVDPAPKTPKESPPIPKQPPKPIPPQITPNQTQPNETKKAPPDLGSTTPSPADPVAPESNNLAAEELLEKLRQAIVDQDLPTLKEISRMSDDRQAMLDTLFRNYPTIEASLGEIVTTPTGVNAVLRIEKLVDKDGALHPVGESLRKIPLSISNSGNGPGTIKW